MRRFPPPKTRAPPPSGLDPNAYAGNSGGFGRPGIEVGHVQREAAITAAGGGRGAGAEQNEDEDEDEDENENENENEDG